MTSVSVWEKIVDSSTYLSWVIILDKPCKFKKRSRDAVDFVYLKLMGFNILSCAAHLFLAYCL